MILAYLLVVIALVMEAIGSLISIMGVSALYSKDVLVVALIIALDLAKLGSVSFLYQHWAAIPKIMRGYMTTAVVALVLATSSGAFGYLTGQVQAASAGVVTTQVAQDALQREHVSLERERAELAARVKSIEKQVAELPADRVLGRQRLLETFKPQLQASKARTAEIDKRLAELNKEQERVELQKLSSESAQGPLASVAKTTGVSVTTLTAWVTLLIVLLFDPLAISLLLAANFIFKRKHQDKPVAVEPVSETIESFVEAEEVPIGLVEVPESPKQEIIKKQPEIDTSSLKLTTAKPEVQVPNPAPCSLDKLSIGLESALFSNRPPKPAKIKGFYEAE